VPPPPTELPLILAGPLLRRVTATEFTLWWVASEALTIQLQLGSEPGDLAAVPLAPEALKILPLGQKVFVHCLAVPLPPAREQANWLTYDLQIEQAGSWISLFEMLPQLCYNGDKPRISLSINLSEIWHGSCRKPHHPSPDALVAADAELAQRKAKQAELTHLPNLLMLTGDQIYNDDLCGPMLLAVHQAIALLGLPNEIFPEGPVADSEALYQAPDSLYGRRNYLPQVLAENRFSRLFSPPGRPVFTSSYCDNHLISFAESFVLYLLCWSPVLWPYIHLPEAAELQLSPDKDKLYTEEKQALEGFVAGLPQVQRLLAHLPTYMIFDDHDITDDWNLTAAWEEAAYGHAFSRRVIGNALMAYWLCQGWGNDPKRFEPFFWQTVMAYCHSPEAPQQDALIEDLLNFENWHYSLPTFPKLLVLDTRTRRWHAEDHPQKPSGLMDWESLIELQQALLHSDAVVLVSPAPMFGVKLIEVIQESLAMIGQALAVDAENWMAHSGAAKTLLSIFKHGNSPRKVVILSGDVHYSFVYDLVIRFRRNSPHIWQITASGLKNEFPAPVLKRLAALNRLLYHRNSPLNWFTTRKRMKIESRRVEGQRSWQLLNRSGLGVVKLNPAGEPWQISVLTGSGETLKFEPDPDSPIGALAAETPQVPREKPRLRPGYSSKPPEPV
jgi:hypothetical protein